MTDMTDVTAGGMHGEPNGTGRGRTDGRLDVPSRSFCHVELKLEGSGPDLATPVPSCMFSCYFYLFKEGVILAGSALDLGGVLGRGQCHECSQEGP